MQRPEYLGGSRVPININQVVQTSETGAGTPQGNTAAYSVTTDSHKDFTKPCSTKDLVKSLWLSVVTE